MGDFIMNKHVYQTGVIALLILLCGSVQADSVFDGWNDGSINGWLPATGIAALEVHPSGGYVNGYLSSTESIFTNGIVGAINYGSDYTGDFNAQGYGRVQVAVKFTSGTFYSAYFHVRYLNSGNNGWQLPLNADYGNTDWQLFVIDFDPAWTDQQAEAAGWVQEAVSPSFASTMAEVYSSGIKAHSMDAASLGLDHFSLQDLAAPTEDTTWAAVKTLYR
jgi:hypothetical protein